MRHQCRTTFLSAVNIDLRIAVCRKPQSGRELNVFDVKIRQFKKCYTDIILDIDRSENEGNRYKQRKLIHSRFLCVYRYDVFTTKFYISNLLLISTWNDIQVLDCIGTCITIVYRY